MKKTKRGFTIVELVIVIGVIAILSAVLIPTFVSLSSKAKESVGLQEVTNTYTEYVIEKGENAKAREQVAILRDGKYWTFDSKWVEGSTTRPSQADATADFTISNMSVYEYDA